MKQTILYGAGAAGIFAATIMRNNGEALCFCDKKKRGIEPITGLPIISPQAMCEDYANAQIIITSLLFDSEIFLELKKLGISEDRISEYYTLFGNARQNEVLLKHFSRGCETDIGCIKILNSVTTEFEFDEEFVKFRDLVLPFRRGVFAVILDTFLPYVANLSYSRINIDCCDMINGEGSYLLSDIDCPMEINAGDVVIDAGAWSGDFSLLASKIFGATSYAFEPGGDSYKQLLKTIKINDCEGSIIPVNIGLGSENTSAKFNGGSVAEGGNETVKLTTLDDFVATRNIERVDFIKADIEGFEREMLRGAAETLRKFAPKLSFCTYHYPEDQVVIRMLISKANPAYIFEQRRHKLFAWVRK